MNEELLRAFGAAMSRKLAEREAEGQSRMKNTGIDCPVCGDRDLVVYPSRAQDRVDKGLEPDDGCVSRGVGAVPATSDGLCLCVICSNPLVVTVNAGVPVPRAATVDEVVDNTLRISRLNNALKDRNNEMQRSRQRR